MIMTYKIYCVSHKNGYIWTPLMYEAMGGTTELVSTLIKAGAELEARDEHGNTPLMFAASHNKNPEVVSVLIKAGAELEASNEAGATPLMSAAQWQSPEVVSVLIEAGADVNAVDEHGYTPLMSAASPEVVSVLIEAGAGCITSLWHKI